MHKTQPMSTRQSTGTKSKRKPAAPTLAQLTQAELQELRLRAQAVTSAAHAHILIREAFESKVAEYAKAHGLSGKCTVNVQTGIIAMTGEAKECLM